MPVYFNGPNKFPCPCPGCRRIVPANLGINTFRDPATGRWLAWHKECLDAKNAAADIDLARQTRVDIDLEDDGDRVSVRFTGPGSRTAFSAILSSHGYFFDRDAGQSFGSIDALPKLIEEVKDRYDVHLTQRLQETMEARLEQALDDQAEAAKRATNIDAILKRKDAKLSLYEFQKKSIQWLAPRRKALLGHPMGLGKSVIASAALAANAPVLIVCPKNAVGVWVRELCTWRPDYAACRTRTRGDFTFLEPERGIKLLEGKGSFQWPRPGEVSIIGYSVLPLTPAEWEEAQAVVSEWEAKGQPESFTWRPPWFEDEGEKGAKGIEVDAEEIEAARRLLDGKERPVTPPPEGVQVIFDECFVGDTVVTTREGPRTIRSIVDGREGEEVEVLSWDADLDRLEWKPVVGRFRKSTRQPLVEVRFSDGAFVCTADHKIWTIERGYRAAAELDVGDTLLHVSAMPGAVRVRESRERELSSERRQAEVLRPIVLCEVEGEQAWREEGAVGRGETRLGEVQAGDEGPGRIAQDEAAKPHARPSERGEDAPELEGTYIPFTRREQQAHEAANLAVRGADGLWIRSRVGESDRNEDYPRYTPVAAQVLQGGRGDREPEAGHRGGRQLAQAEVVEVSGPPEGVSVSTSRVVGVEVLERGGGRGPALGGGESGSVHVYDIEVADNHNFFANGALVSNCHMVKFRAGQKQSNRAKRFMAVAEYVRANGGRTWGLTGTPLLNEPTELWSVLRACGLANEVFGTRKAFDAMFAKKGKGFEAKDKRLLVKKLQRGMLRFSKEQALKELPPKTREHVHVDISPEDIARLDALMAEVERLGREKFEALAEREQEAAAKAESRRRKREEEAKKRRRKKREEDEDYEEGDDDEEELTDAEKLRKTQEIAKQAAQDGYVEFTELSRVRRAVAEAKIGPLFEIVRDRVKRGPVVVFSDHKDPVEFLAEKFGGEAGGWGLITGDTSAKKRAALAEAFQRGKLVGIAATILAAGVALTLTRSHRAIFCDENWVPALNRQAQDRVHRIGQFTPVTIEVLVAKHPIDEMIAAANERKIRLEEQTVDAAALDIDEQVVTVADEFMAAAKAVDDIHDAKASSLEDEFEASVAAQYEALLPPSAPPPPPAPPRTAGPTSRPTSSGGVRTGDVYEPPDRTGAVTLPPVRRPDRIPPTTPEQVKAAGVILALMERGGFRQGDTFTPSLAQQLATQGGLSEKQWPWAIRNAAQYSGGAPVSSGPGGRRQAANDLERWAAQAMVTLAGGDTDRAQERNDVGFSKFDGDAGHDFAEAIQAGKGLTEGQWAHAVRLAHRYRRQVGSPPSGASPGAPQQNPRRGRGDDGHWHVVVSEGGRGEPDEGVLGPDDIVVRLRGDVPEELLMPKVTYTPEEAAGWADAHGIPVERVEG